MTDEELLKQAEDCVVGGPQTVQMSIAASLLLIARKSSINENQIRIDEQMLHVDNRITMGTTHRAIADARIKFLKGGN